MRLKVSPEKLALTSIQAAAETLESACVAGTELEETHVTALLTQTDSVIDGISRLEQLKSDLHATVEFDEDLVEQRLVRLQHCLEESDTDALDVLAELAQMTTGHRLANGLSTIRESIDNF